MKKKNKKIVPLVILLDLLALLIGAYVLLLGYNEKAAQESSADTETEQPELTVSTIDSAYITAISYKGEKLDISLSLSSGKWIITDDEKYPVDQSAVEKMLSAVSKITASVAVEGTNLADFGLDEPTLTITVTTKDGESVFTIGNVNNYNDLTYLGYEGKVYMISDTVSSSFTKDKDGLFGAADSFPDAITDESVTSVTVTNSKSDSTVVSDADGIEDVLYELEKYCSFAILKGYGLDKSELEEYGISDSGEKVSVEYTHNNAKASFELIFGKNSAGECFYTVPGSTTVYGIDVTGYDAVMAYAYYTPAEDTAEATE